MRALLTALGKTHDPAQPLQVDGALYTANSIFGIVSSRNPSTKNARLVVNGTIVAADIGLLAGSGIRVNYDARAAQLLDIVYDSQLSLRRLLGARGLH
jgi:putative NIF3 family GTP cyclohydrolase 1 type 2